MRHLLLSSLLAISAVAAAAPSSHAQPVPDCFGLSVSDGGALWQSSFTGRYLFRNTGTETGFAPFTDLLVPVGYRLTGANLQNAGVTITEVATAQDAPVNATNPLTGATVEVPPGYRYYFLRLPAGQLSEAALSLQIDLAFSFEPPPSFDPLEPPTDLFPTSDFLARCGFGFGDDPLGGTPILDSDLLAAPFTPRLVELRKTGAHVWVEGPIDTLSWSTRVRLASGVEVSDLVVTDLLPPTFIVTDLSANIDGVAIGQAGGEASFALPPLVGTGGDTVVLTVQGYFATDTLEDACGYDAATPGSYYVANAPSAGDGGRITAAPFFEELLTDPDNPLNAVTGLTADHNVRVWPTVINETLTPSGPYVPGTTFRVNLTVKVGNAVAIDDATVTSLLADGLEYLGNATLSVGGAPAAPIDPVEIGLNTPGAGQTELLFALPDLSGVSSGVAAVLSYDVEIRQFYLTPDLDQGEPIQPLDALATLHTLNHNLASATSAETCGADGSGSNRFRINENQSQQAATPRIRGLSASKRVVGIQRHGSDAFLPFAGDNLPVSAGDRVTFRLRSAVPSGDVAFVTLKDFFPTPKFDATELDLAEVMPSDDPAAPVRYGPLHTPSLRHDATTPSFILPLLTTQSGFNAENSLSWRWNNVETITYPDPGQEIDLYVTLTALPFRAADGSIFTNLLNVTSVENFLELYNMVFEEPDIAIHKRVLQADNPSATVPGAMNPATYSFTSVPETPQSPTQGVDAGDRVTYAIVVGNEGRGRSYELRVRDVLPAGLNLVPGSVQVTYGAASRPYPSAFVSGDLFGANGLTLSAIPSLRDVEEDPAVAAGDNLVVITYEATLGDGVTIAQHLTNTATADQGLSLPRNEVEALAARLGRQVSEFYTVPSGVTASATVVVAGLAITKTRESFDAPLQPGGLVTYTVRATFPEGVHQNVTIEDTVAGNLPAAQRHLVSIDAVRLSSGVSVSNLPTAPIALAAGTQTWSWDFGTLTNADRDNAAPDFIEIDLTAQVRAPADGTFLASNRNLGNGAVVRADRHSSGGGGVASANANAPVTGTVDPNIGFSCSATSAVGNQTLNFNHSFAVGGGTGATAHRATLSVTLPSILGNITNVQISPSGSCSVSGNTITCNPGTMTTGASPFRNISYQARVSSSVVHGSVHNVVPRARWHTQPSNAGAVRLAEDAFRDVTCEAPITIPRPTVAKSKLTAGTTFRVGERIDYRITTTVPGGRTNDFRIQDDVPAALTYLSASNLSSAGGLTLTPNSIPTPTVSGRIQTFTWTTVSNFADATARQFSFDVTMRATGTDGQTAANRARHTTEGFNGSYASAPSITVREPSVALALSVTSPMAGAESGTLTVTATNAANRPVPGYDAAIVIPLNDTGLSCESLEAVSGSASSTCGSVASPVELSCTADEIRVTAPVLGQSGGACTFTFNVRTDDDLPSGTTFTVPALTTYFSLPSTHSEADHRRFYTGNGSTSWSSRDPVITKTLESTSSELTSGSDLANGERADFLIRVALGIGRHDNLTVLDDGTGLQILEAEVVANPANLAFDLAFTPANTAGDTATLAFGTVTVPEDTPEADRFIELRVHARADFDPAALPASPRNRVRVFLRDGDLRGSDAPTFRLVRPELSLTLNATPAFVLTDDTSVLTSTLSNAPGAGPMCPLPGEDGGTYVTITLPEAFDPVLPLNTDGLDNDGNGATDEGLEADLFVAPRSMRVRITECLLPGQSRSFALRARGVTSTDAPIAATAILDDYLTLGSDDPDARRFGPPNDGFDNDGDGQIDVAGDVTRRLMHVNGIPVADPFTVWMVTTQPSHTFPVASRFSDPEGDSIVPSSVTVNDVDGGGSATGNSDGSVTFTPSPAGTPGTRTMIVGACDDDAWVQGCGETTATIIVNDPPIIPPVASQAVAGQVLTFPAPGIAASADEGIVTPGMDLSSLEISTQPGGPFSSGPMTTPNGGTCAVVDGAVRYTAPDTTMSLVNDSCAIRMCESQPDASSPIRACGVAVYTFAVIPGLSLSPDAFVTAQDTTRLEPIANLLDNDRGFDPSTFQLVSGSTALGGQVLATGTDVVFVPAPGSFGEDTFSYRLCEPAYAPAPIDCAVTTVTVFINRPPAVEAPPVTVVTGTPSVTVALPQSGFDPDAGHSLDPTTYAVVGPVRATLNPSRSASAVIGAGGLVLTPASPGVPEIYEVTLRVCDDFTAAVACTTFVQRITYNDPPVLPAPSVEVEAGGTHVHTFESILAGTDVRVVDGGLDPTSFQVAPGTGGTFGGIAPATGGGSCAIDAANEAIVFTAPDEATTATCRVRLCETVPGPAGPDATGRACGTSVFTWTVIPAITAEDDAYATATGEPLDIPFDGPVGGVPGLRDNDHGFSAAPPTFPSTTTQGGTLFVDLATGRVRYTPPAGFSGTDTFTYTICDTAAVPRCATATVRINVNAPPTVEDQTVWVTLNTPDVVFDVGSTYVDGDTPPDPMDPDVVIVETSDGAMSSSPADGEEPGMVRLTPVSPETPGEHAVVVRVCDLDQGTPPLSLCTTATLTVIYNDPPSAETTTLEAYVGGGTNLPLGPWLETWTTGLIDGGIDPSSVQIGTSPGGPFGDSADASGAGGRCVLLEGPPSRIDFESPDVTGTSVCYVRVCESLPGPVGTSPEGRACGVAAVEFIVRDNLVTSPDIYATGRNVPLSIDVTNDAGTGLLDNDGGFGEALVTTSPTSANGGIVWTDGTTVVYSPASDFFGVDTFTYRVCDAATPPLCLTETVTIHVNHEPAFAPLVVWTVAGAESHPVSVVEAYSDVDGDPLRGDSITVTGVTGPFTAAGSGPGTPEGSLVVSPADPQAPGVAVVTYRGCDDDQRDPGFDMCASGTLTLNVNDPPTIQSLNRPAVAGQRLTFPVGGILASSSQGLLAPGWDPSSLAVGGASSGPFGIAQAGTALGGTCAVIDGAVVYDAPTDIAEAGSDTCYVRICETLPGPAGLSAEGRACGIGTFTFEVQPGLFTAPDFIATQRDRARVTAAELLLANDRGFALETFSLPSGTSAEGGTVSVFNGEVTYRPPSGFAGTDSFTYRVCEPAFAPEPRQCAVQTVEVFVNAPPVVPPVTVWVVTGTPTVTADIAGNVTDPEGHGIDRAGIRIINPVLPVLDDDNTSTTSFADGFITVTPDRADEPEYYAFTVEICDTYELAPACSVRIAQVVYNDPPTVADYEGEVYIDSTLSRTFGQILADSDVNVIDGLWDTSSIAVSASAEGPFDLTAQAEDGGTCRVADGRVSFDAPSAAGESACYVRICERRPGPAGIDPTARACGVGLFVYRISDTAVRNPDAYATEAGVPLVIDLANDDGTGLLDNDFGVDADSLTVSPRSAEGGFVIREGDTVRYIPGDGFAGTDTFTYRVCDLALPPECDDVVVTVNVNARPELEEQTVWVAAGSEAIVFDVRGLAYSDLDDDPMAVGTLRVLEVSVTLGGAVEAAGFDDGADPGTLRISPSDPGAATRVSITYEACDDDQGQPKFDLCNVGVVHLVVNDPPTLAPVAVTVAPGASETVPFGELFVDYGLIEGVDPAQPDTSPLGSVRVGSSAEGPFGESAVLAEDGACAIDAEGDVIITAPTEVGDHRCHVEVCEAFPVDPAPCAVTEVLVQVPFIATAASDDLYVTAQGVTLLIDDVAQGILANDSFDDLTGGTVRQVIGAPGPTTEGVLTMQEDGTFTFAPVPTFVGTLTFEYEVCDSIDRCDTATVTIIVNDPPSPVPASVQVAPGGEVSVDPVGLHDPNLVALTGPNGEVIRDVQVGGSVEGPFGDLAPIADGSCAVIDGQVVIIGPTEGGLHTCWVQVCEAIPAHPSMCTVAPIELYVPGVGTEAVDDRYISLMNRPLTIDDADEGLLANDVVDPELTLETAAVVDAPDPELEGEVALSDDGTFVVTPVDGFVGEVVFTYETCDNLGRCAEAEVTIVVNDPPPSRFPRTVGAPGDTRELALDALVTGTGEVTIDLSPDGDGDGLRRDISVSAEADGVFGAEATLGEDGLCTGSDDGSVHIVNPSEPGLYMCYALVCEDAPEDACTAVAIEVLVLDPAEYDADGDGICDVFPPPFEGACEPGANGGIDNCPDVPNPDQADMDEDGIGDACDRNLGGVFWRDPFNLLLGMVFEKV